MTNQTNGKGIKLTGNWNQSGAVLQTESLSTLSQLESGLEKLYRVDCSEINSVDRIGLQLLLMAFQTL